jgi:uncharacterized lipoprotein
VKKLSLLIISVVALSACSSPYSSTGENQYLHSRNGNKVVVPAPLTKANLSYFYVLPEQTQNAKVSISPNT